MDSAVCGRDFVASRELGSISNPLPEMDLQDVSMQKIRERARPLKRLCVIPTVKERKEKFLKTFSGCLAISL